MNGRIYDGRLGRFLQADPQIQEPNNAQSLNRYSYVINNPLSYTDPTGYNFFKKFASAIVGIALVYFTGGLAYSWFAASWYGAATAGAIAGGIGVAVNGGNILKGAVMGAFSGAAFFGVGSAFGGGEFGSSAYFTKVGAHGMVGGVMSVLQGGKFGHGFAAAGVTQAFAKAVSGLKTYGKRVLASAILGGTASKISGGKFANGAITGAFSRMFNDEMHSKRKDFSKARNTDELLAMVKGEEYKPDLLVIDNTSFDELGAYDFAESMLNSLKENLGFNVGVEAAYGSGFTALGTFNLNGDYGYDVAYTKGLMFNPIGSVSGTVYSSGKMSGFYQTFNLCAIGCINIMWNYQNYSIGTSIGSGIGVTLETGTKGDF